MPQYDDSVHRGYPLPHETNSKLVDVNRMRNSFIAIDVDMNEALTGLVTWARITGTPTDLAGYGITDAYTQAEVQALIASAVNEIPWSTVTGTPNSLAGYGILDAYTNVETDAAIKNYSLSYSEYQSALTDGERLQARYNAGFNAITVHPVADVTAGQANRTIIYMFDAVGLTLNFANPTSMTADWHIDVVADGEDVTIAPAPYELDGSTDPVVLSAGSSLRIIKDGTGFKSLFRGGEVDLTPYPQRDVAETITEEWNYTKGAQLAAVKSKAFYKGPISGLYVTNNATDILKDIDISPGSTWSDEALPSSMHLAAALTKKLDANWAAGTDQGALDTGALIAGETYFVHLIARPDTGQVDVLVSLSRTAPTMPANYTRRRCIRELLLDDNADLIEFKIVGDDEIWWWNDIEDLNTGTPAGPGFANRTYLRLTVPTGIEVSAMMIWGHRGHSAEHNTIYCNLATWPGREDSAREVGEFKLDVGGGWFGSRWWTVALTNTSGQVEYYTNGGTAPNTYFTIKTHGYRYNRERL